MRMRRLKLIFLFRSVPSDDIKLRELLEGFGLLERFTPYVSGGRGPSEATKQGIGWRGDETRRLAEVTLIVSSVAMVAAIVAAVRR
jgi:hypothetical protein